MSHFLIGGSPAARRPHTLAPGPGDRVIAADRGAYLAQSWGWPVHLLVGDLDSLPAAAQEEATAAGIPTVRAPAAKDDTDLELALAYALREGARRIVICAVLGGRTDHLLANLLLLGRPDLAGIDVLIADGPELVRALRGGQRMGLAGRAGDLVSLLPIAGDAVGVTTEDLAYPLLDETLYFGRARGVSNVIAGPHPAVALREGMLIVCQTTAVEHW